MAAAQNVAACRAMPCKTLTAAMRPEAKRAPHAEDPALAKRLWDVSIAMTGIDPGLPAA